MIESAAGLVLRTRPLTESSIIVHWLTADLGRLATVAKGAHRPKSPFRGKLDLFYEADFTFARSRRSELHTLREMSLRDTHTALREDLVYLRQASYAAALLEQTTETETPLPGMLQLMKGFLSALPERPPEPQMLFAFELKLARELGLEPDLEQVRLTPGAREILKAFLAGDWARCSLIRLSNPQKEELRQFLHGFLIYHLGKLPPNRTRALLT